MLSCGVSGNVPVTHNDQHNPFSEQVSKEIPYIIGCHTTSQHPCATLG
jgi:hypothetical protein